MPSAILGWVPILRFATVHRIVVLAAVLVDQLLLALADGRSVSWGPNRDRRSFIAISLGAVVGLGAAAWRRYRILGLAPGWIHHLTVLLVETSGSNYLDCERRTSRLIPGW
jgi:hypothetical protein